MRVQQLVACAALAAMVFAPVCAAAQEESTASETLVLDTLALDTVDSTQPMTVVAEAEPVVAVSGQSPAVDTRTLAELEASLDELINSAVGDDDSSGLPDPVEFERYIRSKSKSQYQLGLNDVVILTVCKNLNIKVADIQNLIAHDEIHAQEGIFDLNVTGRVEASATVEPSATDFDAIPPGAETPNRASRDRQMAASLGLSQLMPTGAVVELLFDNTKNYTNSSGALSPNYRFGAGLRARQPLLRDGGPLVTQSEIIKAQYDNLITNSSLRQQVIAEVSAAMQDYYELIFAAANVDVVRIALAQAQELKRVNSEKFKAGTLPELDVLQADADVASRQGVLIEALQNVETVSDLVKLRLAQICEMREVALIPADSPVIPNYTLDEKRFLAEAVCYRPEFEQVKVSIDKAILDEKVSHNRTLPALDAYASYFSVGREGSNSDAIDSAADNEFGSWSVGLEWRYALQNRAARYRFHQSEKQVDVAFLRLQQTRDNIAFNVRESIRNVETNLQQIKVQRATVQFNRSKVETGQQRQAVGLATSKDVLDFQRDLAVARSELIRAIVDYNKAIIALEASKGTLLYRLNVLADSGVVAPPERIPKQPFGN